MPDPALIERLNKAFAKHMDMPDKKLPAGLAPDSGRAPFNKRRRT